jgi:hypothetical protein
MYSKIKAIIPVAAIAVIAIIIFIVVDRKGLSGRFNLVESGSRIPCSVLSTI